MQVGSHKGSIRHETQWLRVVVLVIAWLIIISLARDVWQIRTGFDRIKESEKRLEAETARNASLKERLNLVMTEGYKEKLIREKLNMQREGEIIVVLPQSSGLTEAGVEAEATAKKTWEKWWNLIK